MFSKFLPVKQTWETSESEILTLKFDFLKV